MAAVAVSVTPGTSPPPVIAEDDDKFAEDECTMDFDDDDEVNPSRPPQSAVNSYATLQQRHFTACQFPGGEDLSRYLPDDDEDDDVQNNEFDHAGTFPAPDYDDQVSPSAEKRQQQQPPSTPVSELATKQRYRKRGDQAPPPRPSSKALLPPTSSTLPKTLRRNSSDSAIRLQQPTVEAERRASGLALPMTLSSSIETTSLAQAKSISSIRERLSRFLTPRPNTRRTRDSLQPGGTGGPTIHDFSFADSKMASEFLNRPSSPSSSSQLETQSDLGASRTGNWWDLGTLRSTKSTYSGSSSTASLSDSAKSREKVRVKKTAVGEGSEKTTTAGKPLFSVFKRRQRSLSVPNIADMNENRRSSSGSKGGETSLPLTIFPVNKNSIGSSTSNQSEATLPPPLPPLRRRGRTPEVAHDVTSPRSHSAKRFSDLWSQVKSGSPASVKRRSRGGRDSSDEKPPNRHSEAVRTLHYTQINDEIPVSF